MREHTPREKALFETRVGSFRRWAQRIEASPAVQLLWRRSHVDDQAALTLKRQDALYRAVLVEPDGDVPHHILDNTVWGYFRNDMAIGPGLFYDMADNTWKTAYSPMLPGDWRRATVNALTGVVEPETVSHPTVPGTYRAVSDKAVQAFLGAAIGGRYVPLSEIPDPYGVLRFPDFEIEVTNGTRTRSNTDLVPITIGGKPPLTYALVEDPAGANVAVVGDNFIVVAQNTQVGAHIAKVRVTDSLGATAEATVTITAIENRNP